MGFKAAFSIKRKAAPVGVIYDTDAYGPIGLQGVPLAEEHSIGYDQRLSLPSEEGSV